MQGDKNDLLLRLGKNLKAYREKNGYTQEKIAELLNIHLVTYQKYESKSPYNIRIYSLYKIAKLFNTTIDELLK